MKHLGRILALLLLILSACPLKAQTNTADSALASEIENYKQKIIRLISFLEGTFNVMGDPATPKNEKEIIINQSYQKLFVNDKVQIEDDLDEKRKVIIHKDVQAYLKDIDFFFKNVKFKFLIDDINHFQNGNNSMYFRVKLNRQLSGITITNDSVATTRLRYIELNIDSVDGNIKIASIYTKKLNEKEEMMNWWAAMPREWRYLLGDTLPVTGQIMLSQVIRFDERKIVYEKNKPEPVQNAEDTDPYILRKNDVVIDSVMTNTGIIFKYLKSISRLRKLNIHGNKSIVNLDPLIEITDLRELDCSGTSVNNLTPLRNLNYLEKLNCSFTTVPDLSPLLYSVSLRDVAFHHTLVEDLDPLAGLTELESINCSHSFIYQLKAIEGLKKLKTLDCSNTNVRTLDPIRYVTSIENLDFSGTSVLSLEPLAGLKKLIFLKADSTNISSLEFISGNKTLREIHICRTLIANLVPLASLPELKLVYCNHTLVSPEDIVEFILSNQGMLVVYQSENLHSWWEKLDSDWKNLFNTIRQMGENPSTEELHTLARMKELDLSGKSFVVSLQPLGELIFIEKLNMPDLPVSDLKILENLQQLQQLNISGCPVSSLEPLKKLQKIRELNIEKTKISTLEGLLKNKSIRMIYADQTAINDSIAFLFRSTHPQCLVIYKTPALVNWWNGLTSVWHEIFYRSITDPDKKNPIKKEQLHSILFSDTLIISQMSQVNDLHPLIMIRNLHYLDFSGTQVTDLSPISHLTHLQTLKCTQNPLIDLGPLATLHNLVSIDITNTSVFELDQLKDLINLKELKCSGTKIKNLKAISGLFSLERLEINNTDVKSLNPLDNLYNLKFLECYNTGVKEKMIQKFRETHPQCKVTHY